MRTTALCIRISVRAGLLLAVVGCGNSGSGFSITPLRGKVIVDGTPATGGIVTMTPLAQEGAKGETGKPAVALIGSDGTFQMTTYREGDGVIVGSLEVSAGTADENKPWAAVLNAPIPFESNRKISNVLIEVGKDGSGKIRPLP